ncbi:MAG: amidophosphoribosyltransferase [Mobiluncus sp.]|uniref:amidophosphoribosyltransferase n=1 Tax=Mobiluncus TaxID=2050 RepID=UPI002589DC0A|nr:amidophosphoribosyltransferase [Mobiluncus sp.]MCI6584997.1 amidophosphoribosyltransferase [Mobiluncus sp.]
MKFDKVFSDVPRDECGVFGVWAPGEDVSRLTYFGLYALQHRGQESAGIAASDGSKILVYKDMGLVSQVFKDRDLASLTGHLALGHVRYSTAGTSTWQNAQPTLGPTAFGTLALAHNGNLVNTRELASRWLGEGAAAGISGAGGDGRVSKVASELGAGGSEEALSESPTPTETPTAPTPNPTETPTPTDPTSPTSQPAKIPPSATPEHSASHGARPQDSSSDTMLLARLINHVSQNTVAIGGEPALLGVMREILPELEGAYSLAFIDETTLYAARDPRGIRPLVLGRLANGWVVASETAALDIVGASFVREIAPGELLAINENGVHSEMFAPAKPAGCVFEYVYLARPDTTISGRSIIAARRVMGAALAREDPVEADLVMATPDSGTPAAIGYAEESGIPFGQGLVKNAYVGRTFIQPTQAMRQMGIRLKLNPVRSVIEGKRLVVIDDSIVRGNTQRAVVQMLRAAGAAEVHVRISSPPVLWPCYYGIDFATRAELIATGMDVEEICRSIGADSLAYLPFDAMVEATAQPESELCTACFSGRYPTELPDLD